MKAGWGGEAGRVDREEGVGEGETGREEREEGQGGDKGEGEIGRG